MAARAIGLVRNITIRHQSPLFSPLASPWQSARHFVLFSLRLSPGSLQDIRP
ncbi:hypothetical protein AmDm5_2087 [Acetobacter malorum]|nr:hypothetical protein AmDm5_2087 [Acetobacter malorum]